MYVAGQAGSGRFEPGGYPYGPYAQFWVEPDRHDEFESTSDIHRCIWVWKRFTEAALQDLCALPESRAIEIRYESLVLEPKEEAKRLKDFLSIDQPSSFQLLLAALKKANPALSKQWKEQLCAQQLSTIEQEAGELLTSLNYGE